MAGLDPSLARYAKSMEDFQRAVENATKATKAETEATEEVTETKRESILGTAAAAVGGAIAGGMAGVAGAFGRGMADPMMLPSEMQRQAGRAFGQAIGGAVGMPEAGALLGEFGGAAAVEDSLAVRAWKALDAVGIPLPSMEAIQGAMGTAARQRFIEARSVGAVRELAGRMMDVGMEPNMEMMNQEVQDLANRAGRTFDFMMRVGRGFQMPPPAQDVRGLAGMQ